MKRGYFKHYRKMVDWPWRARPKIYTIWCYLLEEAAGIERDKLFGYKRITLQPGQLVTGRKQISAATGVSESAVQRTLEMLEREQQITQQKSTRNRLVTIVNWSEYSGSEQQKDNRKTTERQQKDTPREVKDVIECKEYTTTFGQFWETYPRKQNKRGAFKVWEKMDGVMPPIEELIQIVNKQKEWPQFQKFTPHATTWLNNHRWEDEEHVDRGAFGWAEEEEE